MGAGIRGVVLDAETTDGFPSNNFKGKWVIVSAGLNFGPVLGGVLPTFFLDESVTIKSPRILGGNPGILNGGALFRFAGAGNINYNGFSVGFGVGFINDIHDDSGANAVLGGLVGLSIPIKGSFDDPNPDSYPPFS